MTRLDRQAVLAWLLLAFVLAVFYWRIWTPRDSQRAYFEGDIFEKDYPARASWVQTLRQGVFPFWNPYEFGGWPALANCEAGILYPLNWLLVAIAPEGRLSFYHVEGLILVHFVLGGWFLFLLVRRYGLSFWPAILAAMVYMLCGFHGGHKLHVNLFNTIIWFPLILYFVERALEENMHWFLLWAAVFLAVAFLAGHFQMAYFMCLLLLLRLLWESVGARRADALLPGRSALLRWEESWFDAIVAFVERAGLLLLLALGLAAVQVFPALELLDHSRRAAWSGYDFAMEYSLPPQELIEFLLPDTFGWYYVEVFYVGIWAWLLAWVSLRGRQWTRIQTFWVLVLAVALLLALGKFTGLLPSLYPLVPGLGNLRAPSRWLYFVDVAVAILAGFGLQGLIDPFDPLRKQAERLGKFARWLLIALAVVLVYLYAETLKPYPQVHLQNFQGIAGALATVAVFVLLGWLLLVFYRQRRFSPLGLCLGFVVLVYSDLATYNNKINVVTERKAYEFSPLVAHLRKERSLHHRYLQPDDRRAVANGNIFQLEEAGGSSPLVPERYFNSLGIARENANLLRLLGIRYLVSEVPQALREGVREVQAGLWEVPDAFPRAFAVNDVVVVSDAPLRDALLYSEAWDFARLAWVEALPEQVPFQPAPIGSLEETFPRPILIYSASRNAPREGAWIILNGQQVALSERGYNLVALDAKSGQVKRSRAFDTLASYEASAALADFIRSVSEGMIVVGAIRDEATMQLTPQAAQALRSVGVAAELAGQYRMAHAFVGIKGYPPGTALEAVSEKEAIIALGERGERFRVMTTESEKAAPKAVEISAWQPGRLDFRLRGLKDKFVVVTEKDYPGWRVRHGGSARPWVQTNSLFVGFPAGDGEGEVRLYFRPTFWELWLGVSLLSVAALVGGLILTRPGRKTAPKPHSPKAILLSKD